MIWGTFRLRQTLEDVIENPSKAGDVERYGLVRRGQTWFRDLFAQEGWEPDFGS